MTFHFSALKPNLNRVQENYLSQLDIHGLVTLDLLGLGAQTLLQLGVNLLLAEDLGLGFHKDTSTLVGLKLAKRIL